MNRAVNVLSCDMYKMLFLSYSLCNSQSKELNQTEKARVLLSNVVVSSSSSSSSSFFTESNYLFVFSRSIFFALFRFISFRLKYNCCEEKSK